MILNDKAYEILRWVVIIILPACTTLFSVIGGTFNIPYTEQILTVAVAVDTFLGTIFGISKIAYDKSREEE